MRQEGLHDRETRETHDKNEKNENSESRLEQFLELMLLQIETVVQIVYAESKIEVDHQGGPTRDPKRWMTEESSGKQHVVWTVDETQGRRGE